MYKIDCISLLRKTKVFFVINLVGNFPRLGKLLVKQAQKFARFETKMTIKIAFYKKNKLMTMMIA